MGTYTRLDDGKVESIDKGLLVLSSDAFVVGEKFTRVLETDGHPVGVGGIGQPPGQVNTRRQYKRMRLT